MDCGSGLRGFCTAATVLALVVLSTVPVRGNDRFRLADHLTLSASNRARGEFVSWFDPQGPNSNESYNFFANRARFGVTLSFPTVEFFVEAQDTRFVNLPGADAINGSVGPLGPGANYFANTRDREQGETILHRGFATVRNFGLPGVGVRAGRLGYNHGLEKVSDDPTVAWLQKNRISQRLIGNFDYTHIGRSFDGVAVLYDDGALNWTTLAARPTAGGFEISANRQITDIGFVSSTASLVGGGHLGPYALQAFYIYYDDDRGLVPSDNRPLAPPSGNCAAAAERGAYRSCDRGNIAVSTVGANLVQTAELGPGTGEVLLWTAGQFGDWQSLDHQAWSYAAEAGYRIGRVPLAPWLRAGFFRSSGDDDPSDDRHRTFFQLLPTARIYAETPFYNMMNNQDLFVQALLEPEEGATLVIGGHWLRVTESADLLYAGAGANSSNSFGYGGLPARGNREVAYVVDASLVYQMTKRVQVQAYYGHTFGQGVIAANFAGSGADYAFIETTVAF